MIASVVNVSTTATLLVAATANATRTIYLEPVGADVHVGGDAVTTATGLVTKKDVVSTFLLPPKNALYAITGAGTVDVRILQPSGDF